MMGRGKILFAGALIVAAVVYLIASSTSSTARYYLSVAELRGLGASAQGRSLAVSGAVLGDSITFDAAGPQLAFSLAHVPADPREIDALGGLEAALHAAVGDPATPTLDVVYAGPKPDMLRHEAQAIVRGSLGGDGVLYAEEILLKCPSRYEAATQRPEGEGAEGTP